MSFFAYCAAATAAGLLGLLLAEASGSRSRVWIAKPLASAGFVLAAWGVGALGSPYGRAVLVALALCWLGDVLLIPSGRAAFLGGLGSFLAGHVAFAVAFLLRGVTPVATAVAFALLLPGVAGVWRWLAPRLDGALRIAVPAYIAVIALMVALAAGSAWHRPGWLLLAGAVLFFVSDLSVARDRFVRTGLVNRLWGLPLYYAAELLFAASVGR